VLARGDPVFQVGSDHRAKLLAPHLKDAAVKQLGRFAFERGDVDLGVRPACEEGDARSESWASRSAHTSPRRCNATSLSVTAS
jgi:hypothetical protein